MRGDRLDALAAPARGEAVPADFLRIVAGARFLVCHSVVDHARHDTVPGGKT
jgi:hypothetical protein